MTPEELHESANPQLVHDFEKKVCEDILRVMFSNEDIFFGKSLPTGLGSYLCLTPISVVIHSVLKSSVDAGFIDFKDVDELIAMMGRHIKKGIEPVKLPSKCP